MMPMEGVNIFVFRWALTGFVNANMALQESQMVERAHLVSA